MTGVVELTGAEVELVGVTGVTGALADSDASTGGAGNRDDEQSDPPLHVQLHAGLHSCKHALYCCSSEPITPE